MTRMIARFILLLTVLCEAAGESTTPVDSSCVYTFNVPACDQTPDSNTDVEVLKSLAVAQQAQIKQLVIELRELQQQLAANGPGGTPGTGGVLYVRWGRKTCPGNATLLYTGFAGGSYHTHSGGGANYQCLPLNPQWGVHTDGPRSGTYMYGSEYQFEKSPFLKTNYAGRLTDNNVPCAVCHVTERHVKVMVPARKQCPDGWTEEYGGYLTTSHHGHHRATFECMDEAPEVIEESGANQNGALFYLVEGDCGYSLPCPKYKQGWALTCVVCTK